MIASLYSRVFFLGGSYGVGPLNDPYQFSLIDPIIQSLRLCIISTCRPIRVLLLGM